MLSWPKWLSIYMKRGRHVLLTNSNHPLAPRAVCSIHNRCDPKQSVIFRATATPAKAKM